MSGHSKWANIKHRKGRQDEKRGKLWSKIARTIIMAAKAGGGDPAGNLTLRYAIDEAKEANMPKETILNAIKKGTGELGAENYEEVVYEGYGPCGVAFMVYALTDNRQRTGPEMRKIFERAGGQLGATNCVAYLFTQKGMLSIPADKADEDTLMEIAINAGADDVTREGDFFEITCEPDVFAAVKDALAAKGITPSSSQLAMIASNTVTPSVEKTRQVLNLTEQFEDHDDVQKVFTNLDIPDELMKELENEG
ncbi:MAG TPA: YebC/PmpR family DNA-binding transcriptional regulator [Phycisphaerae bacterium]|nr:YebC/PmpR family DNA-binding transcriptional regulator [Phycisphaerae bacterium]HPS52762.1 YebC/PmpR family DNA-binding transcriptional regulator [Phycisphaerae bacterium]